MPPLEAWERVLVDPAALEGIHGTVSCVECHGGNDVADFGRAHDGLIVDPSDAPNQVCGTCHPDVQQPANDSLHMTLAGYDLALYSRSIPENHPALEEMEANHCNNCHATCGQCHVSQPTSVGGGLLEGHQIVETPPMTRTCTGCHGSRVRNEFTGRNEGFPGDVHFTQGRMSCVACHTGNEMHGIGVISEHRYDGARAPRCEDCHTDVLTSSDNIYHTTHQDTLACQVCHSISYKNCSGCHVQQNEEGIAYYEIDPSWMDFQIGLNINVSNERPWKYVLVRHAPVSPTSFEYYGENLLPNFNARPTWLEATPHNIQLRTPQTESCENCHGSLELFLTEDDVLPEELEANQSVIVREIPDMTP